MKAFTVMGRVLKATYEELFLCVYMSLLWWGGQVLVVTAAPAMMGLNRVFNQPANYRRVDSSFFWEGARREVWRGWVLYLIMLAVPAARSLQRLVLRPGDGRVALYAIVARIWLFFMSLLVVQYLFPLFWQQDEPSLRLTVRNALLLAPSSTRCSLALFEFVLVCAQPRLDAAPADPDPVLSLCGNFALAGLLQEMDLAPNHRSPRR
ncbi:MAG: hypothetical protein R3A10_12280 [Caldilineaceae bacterium]